jgi:hypothetical protein
MDDQPSWPAKKAFELKVISLGERNELTLFVRELISFFCSF